MEMEGAFLHPVELRQAVFCVAPKALDSVDVVGAECKLVVTVVDSQMLVETQIDEPVIPSPSIGVKHGFKTRLAANDGLQRGL